MRLVTTKPPTTLSVPSTTARNPRIRAAIVRISMAHDNDTSYDDDPMDGISATHQRRMEDGRYITDHFDSKENGQHQDKADVPDIKRG